MVERMGVVEGVVMMNDLVVILLMMVQCDVNLLVMVLRRVVRCWKVTALRRQRRTELLCS